MSRGRRKGCGTYDAVDRPLALKMQKMVLTGKAASPWAASAKVWQTAKKKKMGNTENAIRKRLLKKYHAWSMDLV